MQHSVADLAQKFKVLGVYKQLYKHVKLERLVPEALSTKEVQHIVKSDTRYIEQLRNEFRQYSVSDSKYCMQKDEMYFLANTYATYLQSTQNTLGLYAKYCKGERSIKEAAAIVGLQLPKLPDCSWEYLWIYIYFFLFHDLYIFFVIYILILIKLLFKTKTSFFKKIKLETKLLPDNFSSIFFFSGSPSSSLSSFPLLYWEQIVKKCL